MLMIWAMLAAWGQPVSAAALIPVSKWQIDYRPDGCVLSRSFGNAAAPVTLVLQPSPDLSSGEVVLISQQGSKDVRRGVGSLMLAPGTSVRAEWVGAPAAGQRGVRISVDAPFWTALPLSASLTLNVDDVAPVTLATGPMASVFNAAKACEDDLVRQWGADPTALIVPDSSAVLAAFRPDDYPAEAIEARQQGRVVTLTAIDPTGHATDCSVKVSSGIASLDMASCNRILRVKFKPAPDGKPATRYAVVPVRWTTP